MIDRHTAIMECYLALNETSRLRISSVEPELVEYHAKNLKHIIADVLEYLREEGGNEHDYRMARREAELVFHGFDSTAIAYEQGQQRALANREVHPYLAEENSASKRQQLPMAVPYVR